ncbi:hypothetical protein [Mycobacterium sp. Marseille-P9652]|uniref:hypothetical protein n=1 Tax=Mycobacterium sp. Marseille-P9652 TaxID=2654950 RepID=UPI0012E73ED5|nr:hypothetical protein [Mycobacterium sp. Marseille-P9652]
MSATLVHPLTEIRLPTLAQTSAVATPGGWKMANISGMAVSANIAAAPAAQERNFIVTGSPFRRECR